MSIFVRWHVFFPEPMTLPNPRYIFDRNTFSLREEEQDEKCHDHHESSEEEEEPEFHFTEHCKEYLSDNEGEEHVY